MPEVNYEILNLPLKAFNLAASRVPRLLPTVPAEFRDNWISPQVARGDWNVDPVDGEYINGTGQTLEEYLEHWLKSRPHAFEPVVLEDANDTTWTEANITKRAARFKELKAFCGSDAAARVLFAEEAAKFGVTDPFSNQKGEKIDPKKPKSGGKVVTSQNPFSDAYVKRHGQEAAYAERERIMKLVGLDKFAEDWATPCGYTVTGARLR
jgi:hypothetical protein